MKEIKYIKKKKAWIIGNIISFEKKPKYKSPFFDTEEVVVLFTKK